MKRAVPMLAALLALAACGSSEPKVTVRDAIVTVPAVPGGISAAYFTIETNRDDTRLVSVSSPKVQSIELHQTSDEGVRSSMRPLRPEDLRFGPSGPLQFLPGGKHGMLMGVDPSVQVGGKVMLTFQLEPGGTVTAEAEVRGPGQAHGPH